VTGAARCTDTGSAADQRAFGCALLPADQPTDHRAACGRSQDLDGILPLRRRRFPSDRRRADAFASFTRNVHLGKAQRDIAAAFDPPRPARGRHVPAHRRARRQHFDAVIRDCSAQMSLHRLLHPAEI
jgi:hypothetical protein